MPGLVPSLRRPGAPAPGGAPPASRSRRIWRHVHTWSSVACTLFLLMLCLTGLPLIFADEIDHWLDGPDPAATLAGAPPSTGPRLSLDRLVEAARSQDPRSHVRFIGPDWENDAVYIGLGPTPEPGPGGYALKFDAYTARVLEDSRAPPASQLPRSGHRIMALMHDLHAELLLDDTGEWVLCAAGALFLIALVSGAVLYAPYMRKLSFGTQRRDRSIRLRRLDLHNFLGIATLAWAAVVGATGVFNTLAHPLFDHWQSHTIGRLVAGYATLGNEPVTRKLASIQAAVDLAHRTHPDMRVGTIVYPNRNWVSPHHYLLFAWGNTALTSKLRMTFLIDARNGNLTAAEPFPWYLRVVELSRPLHFGDYGGLPLKMMWALLDLILIVVLVGGLNLYRGRLRR